MPTLGRICLPLLVCTALYGGTVGAVGIDPAFLSLTNGGEVSVDILVTDIVDLYAFQFDIAFDPSVLSAEDAIEGPLLMSGGTTLFFGGSIDNTFGRINAVSNTLLGSLSGVTGTAVIATLHFTALASGTTSLTLDNPILLDSNLDPISPVPEPRPTHSLALGVLVWAAYRAVKLRNRVR